MKNLWDGTKMVLGVKFIELNAHVRTWNQWCQLLYSETSKSRVNYSTRKEIVKDQSGKVIKS